MTQHGWADGMGRVLTRVCGRAALGLVLMMAAGCADVYRNHGYVPSEEDLALVEVGVDTRETVGLAVGRPSAAGLLNDLGWYYVQSRYKERGLLPPVEEDRQVVAISFTEAGIVENVERFGLEDGRVVQISRRVTDNNVKGASVIRQLFGNIGGLNVGGLLNQ